MNRMELEQRSEECIHVNEDNITVSMKNCASLGELPIINTTLVSGSQFLSSEIPSAYSCVVRQLAQKRTVGSAHLAEIGKKPC